MLLSPTTALYGTIYRCRRPTGSEPRCGSGVGSPPLGTAPGHPSGSRQRSARRRRGQTQRVERWMAQRETTSTANRPTALRPPHHRGRGHRHHLERRRGRGRAQADCGEDFDDLCTLPTLASALLREHPAVRVSDAATRRCRAHGGPTRRGPGDSRAIRGKRAVFGSWHRDQGVRQGGRSSHTAVRTTRVRRGVVLDPGLE